MIHYFSQTFFMNLFYTSITPKSIFNYEKNLRFPLFIFCEKQPNELLQTKEELAAHIVSHEHSISFSGTILNLFATGFANLLDQYILKDVEGIKIIYQTVKNKREEWMKKGSVDKLIIKSNLIDKTKIKFMAKVIVNH